MKKSVLNCLRLVNSTPSVMAITLMVLLPLAAIAAGSIEGTDLPVNASEGNRLIQPAESSLLNSFTENKGQWDLRAQFRAQTSGGIVWVATDGLTFQFVRIKSPFPRNDFSENSPEQVGEASTKNDRECLTVKSHFVGSEALPELQGKEPQASAVSYFLGSDPSRWSSRVGMYRSVEWRELYSGIDLVYYFNGPQLEYDFVIHPGGDPAAIQIQYEGIDSLTVSSDGRLLIHTGFGDLRESRPIAYQNRNGKRIEIESHFRLDQGSVVRFDVDRSYDKTCDLVVDPQLSFSTYLSGGQDDFIQGMAPAPDGNYLVSGALTSSDFPIVAGYDSTFNGTEDHFIAKLSPVTKTLIFSTFIGGGARETGGWVAFAKDSTIWMSGVTQSADYPMVGAYDNSFNGGEDITLNRFSSDGDSLLYSTYYGSSDTDRVSSVAIDSRGNICLPGFTYSATFPLSGTPLQSTFGGSPYDAVVVIFDSTGSSVVYSSYIGGLKEDICRDLCIDAFDTLYLTGGTKSSDFPSTAGAYDVTFNGTGINYDVFVTKLAPLGAGLIWSTFVGGTGDDFAYDIELDQSRRPCVAGHARTSFPVTGTTTFAGSLEAFVAILSTTGASLDYSRVLSGTLEDIGRSVRIDDGNRLYVAGNSRSTNFPVTANATQPLLGGGYDAFVSVLNPATDSLLFSTYVGGTGGDTQRGMALNFGTDDSVVVISGYTASTDFPTVRAYDSTANASGFLDGFVAKLSFSWCCVGTTGNVNMAGIVDLGDLSALVSYLTGGGYVPTCVPEANANSAGIVDLGDLSALVSYLTGGGYVLPNCP